MFLTVVSATVLAHGCIHQVTLMLHPESMPRCADAPELAELGLIELLGDILSQIPQGVGANCINIDAVSGMLVPRTRHLLVLDVGIDHICAIVCCSARRPRECQRISSRCCMTEMHSESYSTECGHAAAQEQGPHHFQSKLFAQMVLLWSSWP